MFYDDNINVFITGNTALSTAWEIPVNFAV